MGQTVVRKRAGFREYCAQRTGILRGQDGLSASMQCLIVTLVALLVFSRDPSLILHAQFYAEDGFVWYANAYNFGWLHSLSLPEGGYLNTLQRLVAGLALWVPLQWAPLVMALAGLLIQVLPVPILLSSRCRSWGPLSIRCVYAAIYVALPNTYEIHVVLTNAQWHFALALALLTFASPPESWVGRAGDLLLFLVGAVSGPFCILLSPLAAFYGWRRGQLWSYVLAGVLAAGAALQLWALLHAPSRVKVPLGATPMLFLKLLGGHVFLGALAGSNLLAGGKSLSAVSLVLLADVIGLIVLLYSVRFAPLTMKLFIVLCGLLFVASLRAPLAQPNESLWLVLTHASSARYWFLPMLAFLWSAVWCAAFTQLRTMRVLCVSLLVVSLFGACRNWNYLPFEDQNFAQSVKKFNEAKPGDAVTIPVYPNHFMQLVKKPA